MKSKFFIKDCEFTSLDSKCSPLQALLYLSIYCIKPTHTLIRLLILSYTYEIKPRSAEIQSNALFPLDHR